MLNSPVGWVLIILFYGDGDLMEAGWGKDSNPGQGT